MEPLILKLHLQVASGDKRSNSRWRPVLCFRLGDKFHLILQAAETTLPSFGHFWQLHQSKSFTIDFFQLLRLRLHASFYCWSSCLWHKITARVEQQRRSRVPEPCEVAAGNLPTEALLMLLWWGADTWAGFEVSSRYLGTCWERRKNTAEWASWWEFIDTPSILWLKQRFFLLVTLIFSIITRTEASLSCVQLL